MNFVLTTSRLRLYTLLAFVLVAFGIIAYWPLQALDYDIFYHLSGGRYFYEHLRPPTGPYFSYLPVKGFWIDYYWGFQVLVYSIYKLFGFAGFLGMRAVLFGAVTFLIFAFFCRGGKQEKNSTVLLAAFISALYLAGLFDRALLVRPHMFSYFFMIAFISIVEYKQRLAWLLPVIALVWCNMHGVEYPVLWLLCGAYIAEAFFLAVRRKPIPPELKRVILPLIVCLFMPLVNPGGTELLLKPFRAPVLQETIIKELMPLDFRELLNVSFTPAERISISLSKLLVLALFFAPLALFRKKTTRISRVMLYLGAVYLLFQAYRFAVEFVILTLPMAADGVALIGRKLREISWKKAAIACAVLIIAWSWGQVAHLGPRPHYPISNAVIPVGAANFLEQKMQEGLIPASAAAPARIVGDVDCGGYMLWRLYPRYKVPMDLETMLFTTFDLWLSYNALYNRDLLEKFITQFSPGFFVAVTSRLVALPTIAQFQNYVPVFIDSGSVLFADSKRYPDLVAKYAIKYLPIAHPEEADFDNMTQEQRDGARAELQRMLPVYPEDLFLNVALARVYLSDATHKQQAAQAAQAAQEAALRAAKEAQDPAVRAAQEAQAAQAAATRATLAAQAFKDTWSGDYYASVAVHNFPESPLGHTTRGISATMRGDHRESLVHYNKALRLTNPQNAKPLVRRIAAAYMLIGEYKSAWNILHDTINPMYWDTSPAELAEMGKAALAAGKPCEALVLLDAARAKAPTGAKGFLEDVQQSRAKISQETHDKCASTW